VSRVARELQAILAGAVACVARWRAPLGVTVALGLVVTAILMPRDAALLASVQAAGADWHDFALALSEIGRFENSSLAFAVVAAAIALVARSTQWRDLAIACLVAGLVAGLAVNVLRPSFGRARPHADVEAGFYWFELEAQLHSMPSGHVMSNSASAFALVPLAPPLLIPAAAYTAGMAWSRMQLDRHYPSDVLWGAILGATVGLAVGTSIRDRRRRAPSTSNERS
jgi:undecaprenyl-diphosphatase